MGWIFNYSNLSEKKTGNSTTEIHALKREQLDEAKKWDLELTELAKSLMGK